MEWILSHFQPLYDRVQGEMAGMIRLSQGIWSKIMRLFSFLLALVAVLALKLVLVGTSEARFVRVGDLNQERTHHTATLLDDGRVLILGGRSCGDAEIYEPNLRKFKLLPELRACRNDHTATKLKDGKVLIIGGRVPGTVETLSTVVEIFDPATDQFEESTPFPVGTQRHSATLLRDGRVLIAGGGLPPKAKGIYLFDPETKTFTRWAELHQSRSNHAAILLADGKVLLAGGTRGSKGRDKGEIIDIEKHQVEAIQYPKELAIERWHPIYHLNDGRIFCNFYFFSKDGREVKSIWYGDKQWKYINSEPIERYYQQNTTTLLQSGEIFISGNEEWPMVRRKNPATGGSYYKRARTAPHMAQMYNPENYEVRNAGKPRERRYDHSLTTLKDGTVLIVGDNSVSSTKAELYIPDKK